jgi:hypothetical protein
MKVIYMEQTINLIAKINPNYLQELLKLKPIAKQIESVNYFLIEETE